MSDDMQSQEQFEKQESDGKAIHEGISDIIKKHEVFNLGGISLTVDLGEVRVFDRGVSLSENIHLEEEKEDGSKGEEALAGSGHRKKKNVGKRIRVLVSEEKSKKRKLKKNCWWFRQMELNGQDYQNQLPSYNNPPEDGHKKNHLVTHTNAIEDASSRVYSVKELEEPEEALSVNY